MLFPSNKYFMNRGTSYLLMTPIGNYMIKLRNLVEIIFSKSLTQRYVDLFENYLYEEYLQLLRKLFSWHDAEKPKHHLAI